MTKKAVLRFDCSLTSAIASGHQRIKNYIPYLESQGYEVYIATTPQSLRAFPDKFEKLKIITLHDNPNVNHVEEMRNFNPLPNAKEDIKKIKDELGKIDCLLIDSYWIAEAFEKEALDEGLTQKIITFDDSGENKHDPRISAWIRQMKRPPKYPPGSKTLCLWGIQYMPVTQDVKEKRPKEKDFEKHCQEKSVPQKGIIFTGGANTEKTTQAFLKGLQTTTSSLKEIKVIIQEGWSQDDQDEIQKIAHQFPYNVKIHKGMKDIIEQIKQSDILFGLGGTIAMATAVLGIPQIVITTHNIIQRVFAQELEETGSIKSIPVTPKTMEEKLRKELQRILNDKEELYTLAWTSLKTHQGNGLNNVIQEALAPLLKHPTFDI